MPVGAGKLRLGDTPLGRTNSMTGADIAMRLAAKAGMKGDVKGAQRNQEMQDQRYALAMEGIKSGGTKSGKTAAVSMKQPNRKTVTIAKSSMPVPKRKPTRAAGTKMTTMARK